MLSGRNGGAARQVTCPRPGCGELYLVDEVEDGVHQDVEGRAPGHQEGPPPPAVVLRETQEEEHRRNTSPRHIGPWEA